MEDNYAVIMAGGVGSRFWPMSTEKKPKQFIDILGVGETLIQQTFRRLLPIVPKENIFIVTNARYRELILGQLPQCPEQNVLYEPIARNTAPCIAWACYKISSKNPEARIIVAPSDHLITNEAEFAGNAAKLLDAAGRQKALFTLGVRPTRPDTGYGYIQYREGKKESIYKVKTFTEKPNLELAKLFMASGDFLWNSGIFIWSVEAITEAIKEYLPELDDIFSRALPLYFTPEEDKYIRYHFGSCPKESIDFGLMEKAKNVYVLPVSFGWSDLGTWASLYENTAHQENKNAVAGESVFLFESEKNIVHTDRITVIRGLKNFIVVSTDENLLICPKNEEQSIKNMVEDVNFALHRIKK